MRDGGNTISKSQSDAEELAWRAGEGRPDLDWKPHGDNQRPHYHPTDKNGNRIGGRSFY